MSCGKNPKLFILYCQFSNTDTLKNKIPRTPCKNPPKLQIECNIQIHRIYPTQTEMCKIVWVWVPSENSPDRNIETRTRTVDRQTHHTSCWKNHYLYVLDDVCVLCTVFVYWIVLWNFVIFFAQPPINPFLYVHSRHLLFCLLHSGEYPCFLTSLLAIR